MKFRSEGDLILEIAPQLPNHPTHMLLTLKPYLTSITFAEYRVPSNIAVTRTESPS